MLQRLEPARRRADADDREVRHSPAPPGLVVGPGPSGLDATNRTALLGAASCNRSLGAAAVARQPASAPKAAHPASVAPMSHAEAKASVAALHRAAGLKDCGAISGIVGRPQGMQRYSIWSLARNALHGDDDWAPVWRSPEPRPALPGDRGRRRRPWPRDRLLPRQGARHQRRSRAREGLARRRQHRAQHHDHPLQLPVRRERCDLRPRGQALGGPEPGAELQRDVQPARRDAPRALAARPARGQAARPCQPAERRRQRVPDAGADPRDRAAAQRLEERALPDHGRLAAAPRRHRAPRRGRLGLRPRGRCPGRRHHPELRGHRHPHRRPAGSRASRPPAARSPATSSRWSPPAIRACSRRWRASACRSRAFRCRPWSRSRSSPASTR